MILELKDINYTVNDRDILKNINLSVKKNSVKVILGSSGSGKTTVLRLTLGLVKPTSGSIIVDDEEISHMSEEELYKVRLKMGMVFQGNALFDSLTVGENVAYRLRILNKDESYVIDKVRESLRFVGIEHTINMMPAELSGGMKKRVAIARSIASSPKLILYDEPTAGLDPANAYNVCKLIIDLRDKSGISSVVITHELQYAFLIADEISVVQTGEVIFNGTTQELLQSKDPQIRSSFGHTHIQSVIQKLGGF